MLFHSFVVGGLGPSWSWLSHFGWMGVDLFFVLSGFLIGMQVLKPLARGERLSFADFYLRRAFRILPAYWAVLLIYLLWPAFRESSGMEPWWKFVVFIMNVNIDYGQNSAFSHAWSLCVEEHFYWLFPLLALWLFRRPASWKFVLLSIFIVAMGIALRTNSWLHNMALDPGMDGRNWFVEDIYYPTWNRLDGLLGGVALAAWKTLRPQHWLKARKYANASLLAGLAVMALSFWLFANRTGLMANAIGWPVLSIGLALLVFAGAGRDGIIGSKALPGVGWLAAISYSLYLVHKAMYHVVQSNWGEQLLGRGWIAFVVYGAAAIAAGAALHYAIERPFLRWRERLPFYALRLGTVPSAKRL